MQDFIRELALDFTRCLLVGQLVVRPLIELLDVSRRTARLSRRPRAC